MSAMVQSGAAADKGLRKFSRRRAHVQHHTRSRSLHQKLRRRVVRIHSKHLDLLPRGLHFRLRHLRVTLRLLEFLFSDAW